MRKSIYTYIHESCICTLGRGPHRSRPDSEDNYVYLTQCVCMREVAMSMASKDTWSRGGSHATQQGTIPMQHAKEDSAYWPPTHFLIWHMLSMSCTLRICIFVSLSPSLSLSLSPWSLSLSLCLSTPVSLSVSRTDTKVYPARLTGWCRAAEAAISIAKTHHVFFRKTSQVMLASPAGSLRKAREGTKLKSSDIILWWMVLGIELTLIDSKPTIMIALCPPHMGSSTSLRCMISRHSHQHQGSWTRLQRMISKPHPQGQAAHRPLTHLPAHTKTTLSEPANQWYHVPT